MRSTHLSFELMNKAWIAVIRAPSTPLGPPGALRNPYTSPPVNAAIFFPLTRHNSRRDYFIRIEWNYRESISGKLAVPTSPPVAAAKSTLRDEAHNGKAFFFACARRSHGRKLVPAVGIDIVVFVVVCRGNFSFRFRTRFLPRPRRLISARIPSKHASQKPFWAQISNLTHKNDSFFFLYFTNKILPECVVIDEQ